MESNNNSTSTLDKTNSSTYKVDNTTNTLSTTYDSGGNVNGQTDSASGDQSIEDKVSFSTYKKTVAQLKNTQSKMKELSEQLNSYQKKEKEIEQKRLEEQGNYKKLLDLERSKNEQYESERNQYKNQLINTHKLNAFCEKLPGRLADPDYYNFVNLDEVVLDPDTGRVDEDSVKNSVDKFLEKHGTRFFDNYNEKKGGRMPSNAPMDASSMTVEEWKKLPLKQRQKELPNIYNKMKNK